MTAGLARTAASLALGVLFFFTAFDTIPARAQTTPSPDLRDDQFAVAYQINPAHSGGITFDQSFAPPLKVLWNDTAEGAMSYPLVARGKVFIWVSHYNHTDSNPQNAGRLYALDRTSGMVLWQADLAANDGYAGLAYDEGRVFLLTLDGILTAFDADSGVQQWSVQPRTGAYAPPIAASGRVFFGGANSGANGPETPETLFAIDETSGSILWSQALSESDMTLGALSGQGVFAADTCNIQGFNPVTGAPLPLPAGSATCENATTVATYYRGFLYTVAIGQGTIFDVSAGNLAGTFGAGTFMGFEMVPAFQGSAGYFASQIVTSPIGVFSAFDFRSGTTLWSAAGQFGDITPPIVVNDTVYYLDNGGTLHAFDRLSGAEVWNANGGSPNVGAGLIPLTGMAAGEGILVVPVGRQLYALVPASGN